MIDQPPAESKAFKLAFQTIHGFIVVNGVKGMDSITLRFSGKEGQFGDEKIIFNVPHLRQEEFLTLIRNIMDNSAESISPQEFRDNLVNACVAENFPPIINDNPRVDVKTLPRKYPAGDIRAHRDPTIGELLLQES